MTTRPIAGAAGAIILLLAASGQPRTTTSAAGTPLRVRAASPATPAQRFRVALAGLRVHYIAPIARGSGVTEYFYGVDAAGPRWAQGTYGVSIGFASSSAARATDVANYTEARDALPNLVDSPRLVDKKPTSDAYGIWGVVSAEQAVGDEYCEARTGMIVGRAVITVSIQRGYSPAARNNPCIDALESARHITDGLIRRVGSHTQEPTAHTESRGGSLTEGGR